MNISTTFRWLMRSYDLQINANFGAHYCALYIMCSYCPYAERNGSLTWWPFFSLHISFCFYCQMHQQSRDITATCLYLKGQNFCVFFKANFTWRKVRFNKTVRYLLFRELYVTSINLRTAKLREREKEKERESKREVMEGMWWQKGPFCYREGEQTIHNSEAS
jgi:hypothetical protein